jgi:hypothetical protein
MVRDVICDPVLIQEMQTPGSDVRCGVNLICRPPKEVVALILESQKKLRQLEPDQYYYPVPDLHLTLLEVAHDLEFKDSSLIGELMASRPDVWLDGLRAFTLRSPRMDFDERSCVLRFETDQQLASLRALGANRVSSLGVLIKPRYDSTSAHVTLMRYVRPVATNPQRWSELLCDLCRTTALTWSVTELWLTWGATWFGMRSRVQERGPYPLP